MNYFVSLEIDIWVERIKKVRCFRKENKFQRNNRSWNCAHTIIILRYFAYFLELTFYFLLFNHYYLFTIFIYFCAWLFQVRPCVPCVQVAMPLTMGLLQENKRKTKQEIRVENVYGAQIYLTAGENKYVLAGVPLLPFPTHAVSRPNPFPFPFERLPRRLHRMTCLCLSRLAPTWRPEANRNICHRVLLQKRAFHLSENS